MSTASADRRRAITCRSFTHARRHPQVIGRIGGWTLPVPITPAQLAVLVGSFVALVTTRAVWAQLGGIANLVVLLVVPAAAAFGVRQVRMEGRSPGRMARGALAYATRPRRGSSGGRPVALPRRRRAVGTRVFVATDARATES